jgi:hypothetical protein
MRNFPNSFEDRDECDEIDYDKVVAISPEPVAYENYEDITCIPTNSRGPQRRNLTGAPVGQGS